MKRNLPPPADAVGYSEALAPAPPPPLEFFLAVGEPLVSFKESSIAFNISCNGKNVTQMVIKSR